VPVDLQNRTLGLNSVDKKCCMRIIKAPRTSNSR